MNVYSKRKPWLAATLLDSLILASPAQAVSFDCVKASTKVEKLICADAELSKLDEELNTAYTDALRDEKPSDAIRQAQKQWMKDCNHCADAACVMHVYELRIQEVSSSIEVHTPSNAGKSAKQTDQPPVKKKQKKRSV